MPAPKNSSHVQNIKCFQVGMEAGGTKGIYLKESLKMNYYGNLEVVANVPGNSNDSFLNAFCSELETGHRSCASCFWKLSKYCGWTVWECSLQPINEDLMATKLDASIDISEIIY